MWSPVVPVFSVRNHPELQESVLVLPGLRVYTRILDSLYPVHNSEPGSHYAVCLAVSRCPMSLASTLLFTAETAEENVLEILLGQGLLPKGQAILHMKQNE